MHVRTGQRAQRHAPGRPAQRSAAASQLAQLSRRRRPARAGEQYCTSAHACSRCTLLCLLSLFPIRACPPGQLHDQSWIWNHFTVTEFYHEVLQVNSHKRVLSAKKHCAKDDVITMNMCMWYTNVLHGKDRQKPNVTKLIFGKNLSSCVSLITSHSVYLRLLNLLTTLTWSLKALSQALYYLNAMMYDEHAQNEIVRHQ